jgi:hypothetical protein
MRFGTVHLNVHTIESEEFAVYQDQMVPNHVHKPRAVHLDFIPVTDCVKLATPLCLVPPSDVHSPVASGRRRVPPFASAVARDLNSMASTHLRHPAPRCLGLAREVLDRAETSRARRPQFCSF